MNIDERDKSIILKIFKNAFPDNSVSLYFFGSRINNKCRDSSDLDILIKGSSKIHLSKIGLIKEALDESDLKYRVDIVDFHQLEVVFRDTIFKKAIKLN